MKVIKYMQAIRRLEKSFETLQPPMLNTALIVLVI